jgi:hypothetical protein
MAPSTHFDTPGNSELDLFPPRADLHLSRAEQTKMNADLENNMENSRLKTNTKNQGYAEVPTTASSICDRTNLLNVQGSDMEIKTVKEAILYRDREECVC